jgi:hypothetical protein
VDRVQAARKIQRSKSSRVHPRHHASFWKYPTESSQTWVPLLQLSNSEIGHKTVVSVEIIRQSHTLKPTDK